MVVVTVLFAVPFCGGSDCFIHLVARFRVVISQMVISTAVRVAQYANM